eukprot:TRINITY_DN16817_c0_g1_i1.p1 TRINITY_DN16817_c0_g1~~TRINITY_DN16817_c0_g1_i1.p1  ORF type:complete len:496 (-),score=100.31 TRINITY_DN16817_c0_g1_i1:28-1515(-)
MDLKEDEKEVQWLSSHIYEEIVIWSSDKQKLNTSVSFPEFDMDGYGIPNPFYIAPSVPSGDIKILQLEQNILTAKKMIKESSAILVIVGAGMSSDCGLPTYRGEKGVWTDNEIYEKFNLTIEQISDPSWFLQNPINAWGLYSQKIGVYRNSNPHDGYYKLLESLEKMNKNFFVFSSNVDGMFYRAGYQEDKIYEAHGSFSSLQCSKPCGEHTWDLKDLPEYDKETLKVTEEKHLPTCQTCQQVARPNVSLFNDDNTSFVSSRIHKQKQRFLGWLSNFVNLDLRNKKMLEAFQIKPKIEKRKKSSPQISSNKKKNCSGISCHCCDLYPTRRVLSSFMHCAFCKAPFCRDCFSKLNKENNKDFGNEKTKMNLSSSENKLIIGNISENNLISETISENELIYNDWKCFVCEGNCKCEKCVSNEVADSQNNLLILEIGCGISAHSLRIETELLLQNNSNVSLVRINPFHSFLKDDSQRSDRQVLINLGAKEGILKLFED